jgi:hypothetical protein
MSGAERAKYYIEQKKLRRRKQKLDCYKCNSEKYNQAKKANRQINGKNTESSKAAVDKQKTKIRSQAEKRRTEIVQTIVS